jgi:protein-disulfide isomerase
MAKGQADGHRPVESGRPGKYGSDPLGLVTLIGVVAVLMISFANWRDVTRIDRTLSERLGKLETQMTQVASRVGPQPTQAAPRRGPDPNRVYTIRTDGAPSRGKANAPVTIVEFSDFQ